MTATKPVNFDSVDVVDDLLGDVIKRVTGLPNPAPRPGQVQLAHAAFAALKEPADPTAETMRPPLEPHHTIGIAPTGTGKAIAGLVPAAIMAAQGKRTIFSTESLSLQAQIIDKDFPVVAEAAADMFGYRPRIALHKGFSNYTCALAVVGHAAEQLEVPEKELEKFRSDQRPGHLLQVLKDKALWAHMKGIDLDLLTWALEQVANPDEATGDRSEYDGVLADGQWQDLSVSSEDCIKTKCPFYEMCHPRAARQRAAEADIVVTNHALLGVQAAKQAPVVVGSTTLGEFAGIVVDEAHALPGWVRSQGAARLFGGSVVSVARRIEKHIEVSGAMKPLMDQVPGLTKLLEADLAAAVREAAPKGARHGEALEVKPDDALPESGDAITAWCDAVDDLLKSIMNRMDEHSKLWLPMNRVVNSAKQLKDNVADLREPSKTVARWLMVEDRNEQTSRGAKASGSVSISLQGSPVDVSGLLLNNVWTRPATLSEAFEWKRQGRVNDDSIEEAKSSKSGLKATMGVVAMSATMPVGYGRQAGLSGRTQEFESPFDQAYSNSIAYIPGMSAADQTQLKRAGGRGMDTKAHHEWASPRIVELVKANRGSALVLAATAANGRGYVDALRLAFAGTGIKVLSQWDGLSMRQVVAEWRDDVSSVLVGTRSMMTGVDAPGRTCSLVILDRIPRSAGNPVDDARVNLLVEDGIADNKWDGDRFVYVADARLLMEQAMGRLIRSINDVGMVAVLDPRLLKSAGAMAYNEKARKMLLKPLLRFPNRITDWGEARSWLAASAADHAARMLDAG